MKNLQSGYRRILLYIFCRNGSSVPPGGPRPAVFFQGTTYSIKAIFMEIAYVVLLCHTPVRTKCEAGMR